MMKAMLSQPMNGKSDEEIVATREKAIKVLEEKGYEIEKYSEVYQSFDVTDEKKRVTIDFN